MIEGENESSLNSYLMSFVLSMYQSIDGNVKSMYEYVGNSYESMDYVFRRTGYIRWLFVFFQR